jgi:ActR/RegA family two-component response regulator
MSEKGCKMPARVLFVDDDVALLKSIQRNICFDYDLSIAESGQQGLDLIRQNGPFSVIVTDMRMPIMDGIQFINEARKIAPDAIFLMLTGNQDVDTSIKAVNQGQVFRFLTKPCETADIKTAINVAHRQFELVQTEKELLHKTFVGSISLMMDVVESVHPNTLQQAQRIDATMRVCEEALGFTGNWEFRLVGRVCLVGFTLMPCDEQVKLQQLGPDDPESQLLLEKMAQTSSRLLGRIPRLERVTTILRKQATADCAAFQGPLEGNNPELCAILLRTAMYWCNLIYHGLSPNEALREILQVLPGIPQPVQEALLELDTPSADRHPVEVHHGDLAEGMVLYDDLLSEDGALLLRSGRRLTQSVIEKMKLHFQYTSRLRPIIVVASSCPQSMQDQQAVNV